MSCPTRPQWPKWAPKRMSQICTPNPLWPVATAKGMPVEHNGPGCGVRGSPRGPTFSRVGAPKGTVCRPRGRYAVSSWNGDRGKSPAPTRSYLASRGSLPLEFRCATRGPPNAAWQPGPCLGLQAHHPGAHAQGIAMHAPVHSTRRKGAIRDLETTRGAATGAQLLGRRWQDVTRPAPPRPGRVITRVNPDELDLVHSPGLWPQVGNRIADEVFLGFR